MRNNRLGRWVAGISVLAAVALGALFGGYASQTSDVDWTAPIIQSIARW